MRPATHLLPLELRELDLPTQNILLKDHQALLDTQLPIVTISAAFTEDLKEWYGLSHSDQTKDIVFSRAHYSMAVAILMAAWYGTHTSPEDPTYLQAHDKPPKHLKISPKKAWLIDPTNYVLSKSHSSLTFTELVGKTIARNPWLKSLKDFIDRFARSRLPILSAITPSLNFLTGSLHQPILSLHIAAGNILAEQGKQVVQVITDPHVRDEYLDNAHRSNVTYCVFDEATKLAVLAQALERGVRVPSSRVVVTGPPIDPRVLAAREDKQSWSADRPLRICLTTGGLGTNKAEILSICHQLFEQLAAKETPLEFQLLIYASTHCDFAKEITKLAKQHGVKISGNGSEKAACRILYHPQIVDANDLLFRHAFPWADLWITKPSGDMAYDAAAAGCAIYSLAEWGEWEHNVRRVFETQDILHKADAKDIYSQIVTEHDWIATAQQRALKIDPLFLRGAERIIEVVKKA
jgi:hypothetical protein